MSPYIFRKTTNCKINVLLLDGHPSSALDITWSVLFGKVARAAFIGKKTLYRNLIWGIPGMHSPMNNHKSKVLPMVESFRRFFLARHKMVSVKKQDIYFTVCSLPENICY
jgi:hypothetical protein